MDRIQKHEEQLREEIEKERQTIERFFGILKRSSDRGLRKKKRRHPIRSRHILLRRRIKKALKRKKPPSKHKE